jgi:S1-C subfamily serine protease
MGVKVVRLVDGGPAKRSGRIDVDDVIQELNGRKVGNLAEFVAAVRSSGALRTVDVKLLRHGESLTVQQPLDGRPHVRRLIGRLNSECQHRRNENCQPPHGIAL